MLLLKERLPRSMLPALGLGLAGVVMVSGLTTEPIHSVPLRSVGYLLLTVAFFSLYTVRVRAFSQHVDPLAVATLTMLGGALGTVPLVALSAARGEAAESVSLGAVLGVVYLAVTTAAAFLLFARMLSRHPSAKFAVTLYLMPPAGVLASWVLLGERLTVPEVIGGTVVLAAVSLS